MKIIFIILCPESYDPENTRCFHCNRESLKFEVYSHRGILVPTLTA